MATCQYNCVDLPDHEQIDCGQYPKGGMLSLGVLECDHNITDFTDPAETNQAIADGELTLIKNIKGTFPEASEVDGENPLACGSETILDGFDFVVTFKDFNVRSENDTFYAALNQRTTFLIWFECETGKLRVVQLTVNWKAKPALVPESNKEKQHYLVTAMWSGNVDDFPVLHNAPADIYD